ncbi:MAG: hypothetical protein LBI19_07815 [Oscillospiraceae bacterium]|jgi:hypothetical protein|nr:hypothetical protein [Oscillospiraceae bacterium]
MKAKIVSSITALTLAGIFLTALALSNPETPAYSTPPDLEPPVSVEPEDKAPADGFWVCEVDGYVAVYHNTDRDMPIEMTGIAVRSLRSGDQNMLRDGVFFEDYWDVVMFLEDFGP